jgi:predicted AAA+ superfamily ATPase
MPVVIRGVFDGKVARPLPGEPVPPIEGEVEVEIVLRRNGEQTDAERTRQAIERLRQMRESVPVLEVSLRELVEEGRRL